MQCIKKGYLGNPSFVLILPHSKIAIRQGATLSVVVVIHHYAPTFVLSLLAIICIEINTVNSRSIA